jgi:hypothetical protein
MKTQEQFEQLVTLDANVWAMLKATSRADIDAQHGKYLALIKAGIRNMKVTEETFDRLEDENFHSLVSAIRELRTPAKAGREDIVCGFFEEADMLDAVNHSLRVSKLHTFTKAFDYQDGIVIAYSDKVFTQKEAEVAVENTY